jgi:hypothetical protein
MDTVISQGGYYPLLDLIGEYSGNTYVLYITFGLDPKVLKNYTNFDYISMAENDDFDNFGDIDIIYLADRCCSEGNIKALENFFKRGIYPDTHGARWVCLNEKINIVRETLKFIKERFGVLPDIYGARFLCRLGNLEMLQWLYENGIVPDVECANYACCYRHVTFEPGILPPLTLSKRGNLAILQWLSSIGKLPDTRGANSACCNGNIEILTFLFSFGILPDIKGANSVCDDNWERYCSSIEFVERKFNIPDIREIVDEYNIIEVLEFLESRGILPNREGANNACAGGKIEVLNWLLKRRILPTSTGAVYACGIRHRIHYNTKGLQILKWLKKEANISPNIFCSRFACVNCIEMLDWIEEQGIFPDPISADFACLSGSIDMLERLRNKNHILPTPKGADYACEYGHLDELIWLKSFGIFPTILGANLACGYGYLHILKWLEENFSLIPDSGGSNEACRGGHKEVVIYLKEKKIFPTAEAPNVSYRNPSMIKFLYEEFGLLPDTEGANLICGEGRSKLLDWLKKKGVVPNSKGMQYAEAHENFDTIRWLKKNSSSVEIGTS